MASYTTIQNGSQGNAVKTWQKYLQSQGYDIGSSGADGIFGSKTLSATKAYQKANGLTVDGIVGKNTWGSMETTTPKTTTKTTTKPKTTTATTTTKTTTPSSFTYKDFKVSDATTAADENRQTIASQKPSNFTYADYEESDLVKQAYSLLQQNLASKPGEYQSAWQDQLNEAINKILNREKFTYDLNGDALYQQYKDQYMLQGQQAMMDTMGQAAAMSGGYGSSYGQSVGQQTYQGYLQQLNNKIPELYQLALDQYNREGNELYNQYGLLSDRENQDYSRHRDTVADWQTDRNYLTDVYNNERNFDYGKYVDDRGFAYGMHRDEVADWQDTLNRADSEYWNLYNRDYTQYTDDKNFDYGQFIDNIDYNYKVNRDKVEDANKVKDDATTLALSMLSEGVTPSADLLKSAGISFADATALANQVKTNNSKKSGSTTDTSTVDDVDETFDDFEVEDITDDDSSPVKDTSTSTYSHAYDYAISQGVSPASAAGLMTDKEWLRRKPYGSTYEEYVDLFIDKNKPKKSTHR